MEGHKEPTARQIMESRDYLSEKAKLNKEVNWGCTDYACNQKEFKKSDSEKALLYSLKMAWRESIRRMGYTKRNIPKTLYTPLK